MKQPLQALLIDGIESQYKIERREKEISIRKDHRAYRVGEPIMLCCHIDDWCVIAKVTEVHHTTLGEVTPQEYGDDGFESRDHLLGAMQKYYPGITFSDPVTVIRWEQRPL